MKNKLFVTNFIEIFLKMIKNLMFVGAIILLGYGYLYSQIASPSNWLYPEGNLQATLNNPVASTIQIIDSFSVKWSTPYISGDVKPLIGNIVQNKPLFNFLYEPNELIAVMGDEIVIINGTGSLIKKTKFPSYVNGIKGISCLIDTNSTSFQDVIYGPVIIGMEGIEQFNPQDKDSLAYSYIFGFNGKTDSILPLKRLAVNLRPYSPNIYASIKPICGKKVNNRLMIYATVNMTRPKILDPTQIEPPYFRGFTQFWDLDDISSFPLPDIKDDMQHRVNVGPEVNLGQPSLKFMPDGSSNVVLPVYPTPAFVDPNYNSLLISSLLDGQYLDTYADVASLIGLKLDQNVIAPAFSPYEIIPEDGIRPLIRPYYVDITDAEKGQTGFILIAEQYSGIDGSVGVSKLHLHDLAGNPLTDYLPGSTFNPYFKGDTNHYWSVAVGNADGNSSNSWLPYFPNNPGKELIVTQSTRDFAYPGSKLFILKYFTGSEISKPTPSGDFLYQFDTIATQRINGWVAAVNDLDNSGDGKEEIILADGSKLMIIRMRDYSDTRFRLGNPFDTVYVREFFNQAILNVSVADLEGDGKNDIIVTTEDSTYIIGSVIPNTLLIVNPVDAVLQKTDYCAGDTINLVWTNIIYSQAKVNVRFAEYAGLNPIPFGDSLFLAKDVINNEDTIFYSIITDNKLIGKSGKIIVEGTDNPSMLSDTSAMLRFFAPSIDSIGRIDSVYFVKSELNLSGKAGCADSIQLEIKSDSISWISLSKIKVNPDGSFNFNDTIPCISSYFICDSPFSDSLINFRLIVEKSGFSDTLSNIFLRITPQRFPIKFDTTDKADPTLRFSWDASLMDSASCPDLSILISEDGGYTFIPIGSAFITDNKFIWNVPGSIPDTLLFRFCCNNSCIRTDTVLTGIAPKYIDIIAPNPFKPPLEKLQIVYKVPSDVTVTILILDQNNHLIGEPVKSALRKSGIVYGDEWDGVRSDGTPVSNGLYYVYLEMSNGIKQIYPVYVRK
jgi:hypothetical protein